MITEVRDNRSRGSVRVNAGTRCHGVAGQIDQNIQIGLNNALGSSEIVQCTDIGKAIRIGTKLRSDRIEFAGCACRHQKHAHQTAIMSGDHLEHPAPHDVSPKIS